MAGPQGPFGAFNFLVDIQNVVQANFAEVDGLEIDVAAIEYREGGDKGLGARKLPGLAKFPNIVLKRGFTSDISLWKWFQSVLAGQVQRTTVAITLLDSQRQPVVRWLAREAWPCKYAGSELNAQGNDVAIETLEICHEGLERVAVA